MVHRVRIDRHDIAVWREQNGTPHAWPNQCPHRGMRLSFGVVRGDRLTCAYHGWTFDGGGRCVVMPADPDVKPPASTVGTYDCKEHAGLLWLSAGQHSPQPPVIQGEWQPCRSIAIHASSGRVVAGLAATSEMVPLQSIPGVFTVDTLEGCGPSLLCAIQPVAAGETMLHVAIEGRDARPDTRRRGSDWAKHLRWHVENETADAAEPARR
jgi:nitrite reductase/ring-hydroxylating ferredoxin subunit